MKKRKGKQQSLKGNLIEDKNPNDDVYTPNNIAKEIVQMFPLEGKILEPCRGNGAFYKYLPKGTEWCELDEGKDFFDYKEKVDWIITNPPYSLFNEFLKHSFEISDNVVFLTPIAKVLKSWGTIMEIRKYGGIKKIWFCPANKCGFAFGFPCGAFHFQRGYTGPIDVAYYEDRKLDGIAPLHAPLSKGDSDEGRDYEYEMGDAMYDAQMEDNGPESEPSGRGWRSA